MVSTLLAAGDGHARSMPALGTAPGVWMTALLLGVTMVAGMPLGIALAQASELRVAAWTSATLVLAFCLLAVPSIGLPYLPAALVLIVVGVADGMSPRSMPPIDVHAWTRE